MQRSMKSTGMFNRIVELVKTETGVKVIDGVKEALASHDANEAMGSLKNIAADKIYETVNQQLSRIPENYRGHIDFDIKNKRLFLSHSLLLKMARFAASSRDDIDIKELYSLTEGSYYCRAEVKKETVSLRFIIEQIIFDDNQAMVVIKTPDKIKIEDRPIINFFATTFISLFGGTEIGETLISSKLPPNIKWDGRIAKCSFEVPEEYIPKWLQSSPVILVANQDSRGLWFTFNETYTIGYWIIKIITWVYSLLIPKVTSVQ